MTRKQTGTPNRGPLASTAVKTTMIAALLVLLSPLVNILRASGPAQCAECNAVECPKPACNPAREPVRVDSLEIKVYFPVAKSDIDLGFHGNGERLAEFLRFLEEAESDPLRRVEGVRVIGYASPEGGYEFNQRLAGRRADVLARHILGRRQIPDSLFTVESGGIDWEGLDKALTLSTMENAHRVQYLIRHEPEFTYDSHGKIVRSRKQQLMNLEGGRTWRWMMSNIFPDLRASASVVCYVCEEPAPDVVPAEEDAALTGEAQTDESSAEEAANITEDIIEAEETVPAPDLPRYPIFALRSNLLVPLLNVGVEVPLAEHWSLGVDYYYPWIWPAQNNRNCFELIFVSAEARYWINPQRGRDERLAGKNCLTGHSVGLYGAWGYYDFERNYHGHQGHGWSVGADYMFALPIAKGRLRLEFELAVGALWSRNLQPYNVYEEGGKLFREKGHRKNFFYLGPTKASVSLVVPITRTLKPATPPLP